MLRGEGVSASVPEARSGKVRSQGAVRNNGYAWLPEHHTHTYIVVLSANGELAHFADYLGFFCVPVAVIYIFSLFYVVSMDHIEVRMSQIDVSMDHTDNVLVNHTLIRS